MAERDLDKSLPIFTTPEAAEQLRERGFTALYPLDQGSSSSVVKGSARLQITSTPGRHGPPVVSFALPEVMGSVLDFQSNNGESW